MTAVREHRTASYNKGCGCPDCLRSNRNASRRLRARRYRAREPREGDVMCIYCCCWFHPKGVGHHEMVCDG